MAPSKKSGLPDLGSFFAQVARERLQSASSRFGGGATPSGVVPLLRDDHPDPAFEKRQSFAQDSGPARTAASPIAG
jgi:hypothetical protein